MLPFMLWCRAVQSSYSLLLMCSVYSLTDHILAGISDSYLCYLAVLAILAGLHFHIHFPTTSLTTCFMLYTDRFTRLAQVGGGGRVRA